MYVNTRTTLHALWERYAIAMERYTNLIGDAVGRTLGLAAGHPGLQVHSTVYIQRHWCSTFSLAVEDTGRAVKEVSVLHWLTQLKQQLQTKISGFDTLDLVIRFDKSPLLIQLDWTCADAPPPIKAAPAAPAPSTPALTGFKGLLKQTWQRLTGARSDPNRPKRIRFHKQEVKMTRVHEYGVVLPKTCELHINRLRIPGMHRQHLVHLLLRLRVFQGGRTPKRLGQRLREQTQPSGRVHLRLCLSHLSSLHLSDIQHALQLVQQQGVWSDVRESIQLANQSLILSFQADLTHTPESLALTRLRQVPTTPTPASAFQPVQPAPTTTTTLPTEPIPEPTSAVPARSHAIDLMDATSISVTA